MLYLEDYLESMFFKNWFWKIINYLKKILIQKLVIENLPQELRDRFTEMRELDLLVNSKFN